MTRCIRVINLRLTAAEEQEKHIEEMHNHGYELRIVDSGFAYFFPITNEEEICDSVDEHCKSLSKGERRIFKEFMIENDELMKDLVEM